MRNSVYNSKPDSGGDAVTSVNPASNKHTSEPADDNQHRHSKANPMWGGRFSSSASDLLDAINTSIDFDIRLFEFDIDGSVAHAAMLAKCKIISEADASEITRGLEQIRQELRSGTMITRRELEDVHMNIEARLTEIIGEAGKRLHTARSRNDQVATDTRMYVRSALIDLHRSLTQLMTVCIERADQYADAIMPGFTHMQPAQPVTFGHHLLAWVEALERDRQRLIDTVKRTNQSPLGAAALAGTAFPIDREITAQQLGFSSAMANSLDAVSARDFVLETLSSCAILSVQLSRMAEEIVLWSSSAFGFVTLSDKFSTGSSIMPQKRNPDAAELVRGKSGRVCGHLTSQIITMKGLALAYAKDLQEDKEALFDALDTTALSVSVMSAMVADLTPNIERMAEFADTGHCTATDLADWLVRKLSVPFRDAHRITATVVQTAEERGVKIYELSLETLQNIEPRITEEVLTILSPRASVESRTSFGGTAPRNVAQQAEQWRRRMAGEQNDQTNRDARDS